MATTKQLAEDLGKLIQLVNDISGLELIRHLKARFPHEDAWLFWFSQGQYGGDDEEIAERIKQNYDELVGFVRQQQLRKSFVSFQARIDILARLADSGLGTTLLQGSLENFTDSLESAFRDPRHMRIFRLMEDAITLDLVLTTVGELAVSVLQKINPPTIEFIERKELSLYFPAPTSYDELLAKLISVREIYAEICRLMDVSTAQYPLEIIKLESGSLWLKIFGENRVITLVTSLVERSVSYFHRNYTTEGKLGEIPNQADSVKAMLSLSAELKNAGINTDVVDKNIEHSSVAISKNMTRLLGGEPTVEVNNERHSVVDEIDKQMLAERETKLLTSNTLSSTPMLKPKNDEDEN